MDSENYIRWHHLAAIILPLLLTSTCPGKVAASWRFPEDSDIRRSYRTSKQLVHPLYSSYNPREPIAPAHVDRSFTVNSNEELSGEIQESNSERTKPLRSSPASSPLYRASIEDRPQQSQPPEYGHDFPQQVIASADSFHSTDSRLPPYRLFTVGQSIQIGEPYGIQESKVVYPNSPSSSLLPLAKPPVFRNWSNPIESSEGSYHDDWEPFIGSSSVLQPHHYPRAFIRTGNRKIRRGSLRFPADRSQSTMENEVRRNEPHWTTTDSPSNALHHPQVRDPNFEEPYGLKKMSLEEFHKAGGFHTLDVDQGDYVFDGHSNIIYRTKTNPPIGQSTRITITPRRELSTTPKNRVPVRSLDHVQKKLAKPLLNQPSNSEWRSQRVRPPPRKHQSNGRGRRRSRKRHFNNIAEIIQAHEERDRRKASLKDSGKHDRDIVEDSPSHVDEGDEYNYSTDYKPNKGTSENGRKPKRWIHGLSNSDFHYGKNNLRSPSLALLPSKNFQHHVSFASPEAKVREFVDQPFIHGGRPTKANIQFVKKEPIYHPYSVPRSLYSDAQATSYHHNSGDDAPYTKPTLYHEHTLPMAHKASHHTEYGYDGYKAPRSYRFGYDVKSHKHRTRYLHRESRKGHTVSGEYRVQLPDGRVQIVQYTADETGYHPIVTYARPDHDHLSSSTTSSHAAAPISHSQFNTFH